MNLIPPSFETKGDKQKAISLKGQAASLYNFVVREADREGLKFINKTKTLADGSIITFHSAKMSNYANWRGKVTITSPISSSSSTSSGSAIYLTAYFNTGVSALFSNSSLDPITLTEIDTTSAFKDRFEQPYIPILGTIFNAPEKVDNSKGLPPVGKACNLIKYDNEGEPIVYSGLREYQEKSNTVAHISYKNVQYWGRNSTLDCVVFDVFLNGNILYVLSGNNQVYYRGGVLHLYSIDLSKGKIGQTNIFDSVGVEIFNISLVNKGYTFNYYTQSGTQSSSFYYPTPYDTTRITDAKFSPEFLTTGEITVIGKLKNYWWEESYRTTEFVFNVVKDTQTGNETKDYLVVQNIVKYDTASESPYNWKQTTVTKFNKKQTTINSSTKVWLSSHNGGFSKTEVKTVGPFTYYSSGFYNPNYSTSIVRANTPSNLRYYADNVVGSSKVRFSAATSEYVNGNGDTEYVYQIVDVPVGGSATVNSFVGTAWWNGSAIYRDTTISNVSDSLSGDTYTIEYDVTINVEGTIFTWHITQTQQCLYPSGVHNQIDYTTITKYWVDSDQYSICGINYITDKDSIDYNTKEYVFFGIKVSDESSIEITKNYYYNTNGGFIYFTPYFNSSSEQVSRFPEWNPIYDSKIYLITEKPTKYGDLSRGYYIGKTFSESIRISSFGTNWADIIAEKDKTWETYLEGHGNWISMNSHFQSLYYSSIDQLYAWGFDHVYDEVHSKDISTIDWSKDTYTSLRLYDNETYPYLVIDTSGFDIKDKTGTGYQCQWYTNHKPYVIQIPMGVNYFDANPIPTPMYHGEEYYSKLIIQGYVYENDVKRIIGGKGYNETTPKKSTPRYISPPNLSLITQASLVSAKSKSSILGDFRSVPGYSIVHRISPDYTFYNISPKLTNLSPTTSLPNDSGFYLFENANKELAGSLPNLETISGTVSLTSSPGDKYLFGYSY